LPPGPICNPGRASLEAALNPAPTSDLYFVADGTGGHTFSETLKEHNSAVQKWRQVEKQQARARATTANDSADPDTVPIPGAMIDNAPAQSKSAVSAEGVPLPVRKPKVQ
jgi:UPF0755 protein